MTGISRPISGSVDRLADQVLVAVVVGVDGDGRVAEHRLGPGGGDVQGLGVGAGDRVPDRPEVAVGLLVLDLVVGDGRPELGVPVDQPLAAEDLARLEQAEEGDADGPAQTSSSVNRVRSQSQEQPISRSWPRMRASYSSFQAQIRSTSASRPRSWRVFFSSVKQPLLDDRLGGDPGVVGAGHPEGVEPLHPPPADQDVLDRVVQRMAQVQRPGDVRRRDDDGVGRLPARRVGVEVAPPDPERRTSGPGRRRGRTASGVARRCSWDGRSSGLVGPRNAARCAGECSTLAIRNPKLKNDLNRTARRRSGFGPARSLGLFCREGQARSAGPFGSVLSDRSSPASSPGRLGSFFREARARRSRGRLGSFWLRRPGRDPPGRLGSFCDADGHGRGGRVGWVRFSEAIMTAPVAGPVGFVFATGSGSGGDACRAGRIAGTARGRRPSAPVLNRIVPHRLLGHKTAGRRRPARAVALSPSIRAGYAERRLNIAPAPARWRSTRCGIGHHHAHRDRPPRVPPGRLLGLRRARDCRACWRGGRRRRRRRGRRAKSVIIVFLTGGPSHHETFDPKPEAIAEIRGEYGTIATRAPGVRFAEHLPMLADRADRLAVVRTMSHKHPNHLNGTHWVLTGQAQPGAFFDKIASRDDYPCYASAMSYLRPSENGLPGGVMLPTFLMQGPLVWPGQHAGFLGPSTTPGRSTATRTEGLPGRQPEPPRRLQRRAAGRPPVAASSRSTASPTSGWRGPRPTRSASSASRPTGCSCPGSVATAFDLSDEPDVTRDRYGRHTFGQSLLAVATAGRGRHPDRPGEHGPRPDLGLARRHLPPAPRGPAAADRPGRLGPAGRPGRPRPARRDARGRHRRVRPDAEALDAAGPDEGRPRPLAAGLLGRLRRRWGPRRPGRSAARTPSAARPATRAYSPADLAATIYRALGIERRGRGHDRLNRPIRLVTGEPIEALYTGVEA